ncbi:methyltransferase family protein [Piscinibacter sp.]|uniref:methyltransferase family protein n=1 Tax=Piscinibacter sp. TaxID=1903157 RepID=UPI00355A193C
MSRWISPPVAFAVAAIVMWWIGRSVEFGRYSFGYQAPVGIALIVLGLGIVAASIRLFVVAGTTPSPMQPKKATQLVTSGAYALSRNPMYVGDAVMLAGIAVWIGSVLNVVLIAAFVWFIDRFQIAAEEAALAEIFGDRYVTYRGKVRRWI